MSANLADFDPDVVVEARDCILGRVASEVAQRALAGERVAVVNAEDAVITGREEATMETYRARSEIGSDQGPHYPSRPDGILKRAVRGMLPYRRERGREAYERVRVYVGNPLDESADAEEPVVLGGTSLDRLSNTTFTSLGEVSANLGANVTW